MKICDLHTHSIFSDGTYTPGEIIDSALEKGLSAVALCDHNTVDGLPEFLKAAENKDIEAVAGAEFSVNYDGVELHLLGLYLPAESFSPISVLMKEVNSRKEKSNIELIESLNRAGYEIDFETIKNKTPNGKFNRANIAAELTEKGYTSSVKEAFDTLLSPEAGHYKEPERLTVWDMLDFIKSIGGVAVLAHPFLNLNEEKLRAFLPSAKAHGLSGMECYYSLYDEETTKKSLEIAENFSLLCSGGSDFHGTIKPDIKLGEGKGNLKIPYEWAVKIKNSGE